MMKQSTYEDLLYFLQKIDVASPRTLRLTDYIRKTLEIEMKVSERKIIQIDVSKMRVLKRLTQGFVP